MPESELQKSFDGGNVPKNIRLLAAGGLIPLPPKELLQLLVRLTSDSDGEVAEKAALTLTGWSQDDIASQLQLPECSPEVIEHFAGSGSPALQEAIILNPHAPAGAMSRLAATVSELLLEVILYNRTRLLEAPEILESIKHNPASGARILGQVQEIETEFFGGKKLAYTALPEEAAGESEEPLPELTIEDMPDDLILEGLPVDPEEREAALLNRIGSLTVRQKIQLALMGTREARAVLIRDTNKEIARGVLQSPKLTQNEVESFASMRSVSEEVLRHIANSKAWTKSYAVVHNLVKNPKTPAMISQRLLMRLQTRDLMMIARDRGISEAVRRNAERVVKQRSRVQPIG
jgi:hypothetical protein